MSSREPSFITGCSPDLRREVEPLIRDFVRLLTQGDSPNIEDALKVAPPAAKPYLLHELVLEELAATGKQGDFRAIEEYRRRFDSYAEVLQALFPNSGSSPSDMPPVDLIEFGSSDDPQKRTPMPKQLGRYRLIRQIGQGGFGTVYLAYDPQLDRKVALKVPRPGRFADARGWQPFLAEARTTAKLSDHPGILTLHDVFLIDDSPVIVQEFVDGQSLRNLLSKSPQGLAVHEALQLLIETVKAIAFAHQHGFYHRDLKPENLLLDHRQKLRVADFGLAVHDDQRRSGRIDRSGSPHYMAPERVRGESHRIDGRSDIWSLGVVFYELLSGRRPFQGKTTEELAEEICFREPVSVRQWRPDVPQEIERLIGRCLAKRQSDRYSSVSDLLADLEDFRQTAADSTRNATSPIQGPLPPQAVPGMESESLTKSSNADRHPTTCPKVIPKGMRSFDRDDASFFFHLVPGPRDRSGMPEAIRFWKLRLESFEADRAFSVGVLYGPSGSGKSSLLKSGVIPMLAPSVSVVYLDAYDDLLSVSLSRSLRSLTIDDPNTIDLPDLACQLRKHVAESPGRKILLVFDQLEQWLQDSKPSEWKTLVDTLRQCDGVHLQTLLVVRDDFWLQLTRLLRDVEVRLVEGENLAAIDLLPTGHAEKVLEWFGRAYQALPDDPLLSLTEEQKRFVTDSVQALAEDERVISIRLSLFAAMMANRPWTTRELKSVGGLDGLGAKYLEEIFCGKRASPENRRHEPAARALLQELLPDRISNLRGAKKTRAELRRASGYENRPGDFEALLRLLDRNLKLISPSEPTPGGSTTTEGQWPPSESRDSKDNSSAFQLTHDYLIPWLREWLSRKQKETVTGRATALLKDRVLIWNEKKESRYLPSFLEWLMIRRWTSTRQWNENEREFMSRSMRLHGGRSVAALLLVSILLGGAWTIQKAFDQQTTIAVERLLDADASQIQRPIEQMLSDPNRYQKKLKEKLQFAEGTPLEARLRLGLLPTDPRHAGRLVEQVLEAPANEIPYLIESLRPYSEQAVERWWIAAKQVDSRQLLPAAAGLARFCKDSPYWQEISQATAQALIEKNGTERLVWEDLLRPAACHWLPHAVAMLQDPKTDAEWKMATQLVLNHASDHVELLRTVLLEGHPEEFRHAFSRYENRGLKAIEELFDEWRSDIPSPEAVGEREHSRRQRRKRMAAIALFQAGGQALLDTLPADPRNLDSSAHFANDARNRITKPDLFIDLLHRLGALAVPQETTRREVQSLQLYTLLLTIGEMSWEEVPDRRKEAVVSLLVSLYGNHPSRAVHSAAGWLLQRWNQIEGMRKIEQTAIPFDSTGYRQWYVLKIDPGKYDGLPELVDHSTPQGLQPIDIQAPFYVTMIAFFPPDTIPANDHQRSQPKSPFAISDREVSWRWFSSVDGDEGRRQILEQKNFRNRSPLAADEPVLRTSWLEAIDTLRWMTKGIGLPENEQCYQAAYSHETGIPIPGKQGLRLPSLAEWRWAVDAKNYRFGYGNDPSLLHRYAWFRDNSANRWHPVANLRPSFHGLFDMEGNVSEWLNDPYSNDTADDDRPNQANTGNPPRCFRGGNWDSPATLCDNQANATEMFGASPGERNSLRGFRLAQSPSSDEPQALIPKSNGNPDG